MSEEKEVFYNKLICIKKGDRTLNGLKITNYIEEGYEKITDVVWTFEKWSDYLYEHIFYCKINETMTTHVSFKYKHIMPEEKDIKTMEEALLESFYDKYTKFTTKETK